MSVFIIGEIGINHNGDINIAKQLIDSAVDAGLDAVKFQKRTVDLVYSPEELDKPRESPFGTTNRDQKLGLEFVTSEYDEIDRYCKAKGIDWFASAWDIESQRFLRQYDFTYNKVASPMLRVIPLLREIASEGRYTFISTGMSTKEEIDTAVDIFTQYDCDFELMHCNSSYPMENEEANLNAMQTLRDEYNCNVGYSGHERGLQITLAAVALGATSVERHITLDRSMYGSDQSSSVSMSGMSKLVRDIRVVSSALGDGKKKLWDSEIAARDKLSNPYWYKKYKEENNVTT